MSDDLTRSIPSLLDTLRERHMSQVSEEAMNRYVKRTYRSPLMPVHFLITATGIENLALFRSKTAHSLHMEMWWGRHLDCKGKERQQDEPPDGQGLVNGEKQAKPPIFRMVMRS